MSAATPQDIPEICKTAVLGLGDEMPEGSEEVKGYDFNTGCNYEALLNTYKYCGFQATNFGLAIEELNKMIKWRLSDEEVTEDEQEDLKDPEVRKNVKATIFFSYTSNMVSAGVRDTIRFLIQHKMVDVVVTTAGGIEEDIIKCLAPTYLGDFALKGAALRAKNLNRIGNLLVPNKNYCLFEDWMEPLLNELVEEQKTKGTIFTPSELIKRMGLKINNEESILYWAAKNDIPIFSPALTDGSIGDMIYFHSYRNPGFILDIAADIRNINDIAIRARKSGQFIIGGGLVKHHVNNANLMRNGADFSVFVNTAHDFDGSDAGAKPDEAVSWGKIALHARPVKICAEATLVLPLLVGMTFAKKFHEDKAKAEALKAEAEK